MRRLQSGGGRESAQRELRMAPADARAVMPQRSDTATAERLERAVDEFARLEVDTRGRSRWSAPGAGRRRRSTAETAELLALARATS